MPINLVEELKNLKKSFLRTCDFYQCANFQFSMTYIKTTSFGTYIHIFQKAIIHAKMKTIKNLTKSLCSIH